MPLSSGKLASLLEEIIAQAGRRVAEAWIAAGLPPGPYLPSPSPAGTGPPCPLVLSRLGVMRQDRIKPMVMQLIETASTDGRLGPKVRRQRSEFTRTTRRRPQGIGRIGRPLRRSGQIG